LGRIGEIIQSAKNVRQLFPTVAEVTQEIANWRKGIKKYDSAKTPFQRILLSEHISDKKKKRLTIQYGSLDPIALMSQLQKLQDQLWRYAWKKSPKVDTRLDYA